MDSIPRGHEFGAELVSTRSDFLNGFWRAFGIGLGFVLGAFTGVMIAFIMSMLLVELGVIS